MGTLERVEKTWEGLANDDPFWAICTDPLRKGGRWNVSEFKATGEHEIETVLKYVSELGLRLDFEGVALDFGCGVGRLTQPLGKRFKLCYGVDISSKMLEHAGRLNLNPERCRFLVNNNVGLPIFEDGVFGFIYSNIVLQHMPSKLSKGYLKEYVRIIKPGGVLVFQVADRFGTPLSVRLRAAIMFRTRIREALGMEKPNMRVYFLSERDVRKSVRGAAVVDVRITNATQPEFNGNLMFLHSLPPSRPVSKQYCVAKPAVADVQDQSQTGEPT